MTRDDCKWIYKKIKQYNTIVIARHVGPDPDAIASTIALRDSILETFPKKNVYAVGLGVSKFRVYGLLDKIDTPTIKEALLIVLDVPTIDRVDGIDDLDYKEVIKIDHHPSDEPLGFDFVDTTASSTCQMVAELIMNTKLSLSSKVVRNLFLGIVSDSDRFLLTYTTGKTFQIVADLINKSHIDFIPLYQILYERPIEEIRFKGYISQNLTVTENGLGYILIDSDIIKEFKVDTATASNMVNDFNFIKDIYAWTFITYDEKNDVYKVNIRSRGPVINTVASKYNGGGHQFASGIRIKNKEEIKPLLHDLDEVCKQYKEELKK